MLKPAPPPYDLSQWRALPYPERMRLVCQAWAIQGYGAPVAIYFVYLLKIGGYVGGWYFFASRGVTTEQWWLTAVALEKAVLWSIAFEGLGLGCGSGPLTGRYVPPVGGFLYFLRPGTTKLPLFERLPLFGGTRRTLFDVALYVAHYTVLFVALWQPVPSYELLVATVVLLPLLGLADKTLFLAARAEHYLTALVCFAFAEDPVSASKIVWVAIWWWAATSKLNRHFPAVVCVMQSNNPLVPAWLRKRLYVDYPNDLSPSRGATVMAHLGTAVEYVFPVLLLLGDGGLVTTIGLAAMLGFHVFITSSVPMGVPLEWNVMMVYGAFVLFGGYVETSVLEAGGWPIYAFLFVALAVIPALGNRFPDRISFLPSMRYYAGNWGFSVWLFRGDSAKKLDDHLVKSAPHVADQLARFYDEDTITAMLSKVQAFRAMHLHGRALSHLLPRAVDDIDAYEYWDGELVAGVVLGWNFGDGHLHDHRLLAAIQAQCDFAPGELVCVFVESQPVFDAGLSWRIFDAATGERESGKITVDELCRTHPWGGGNLGRAAS